MIAVTNFTFCLDKPVDIRVKMNTLVIQAHKRGVCHSQEWPKACELRGTDKRTHTRKLQLIDTVKIQVLMYLETWDFATIFFFKKHEDWSVLLILFRGEIICNTATVQYRWG